MWRCEKSGETENLWLNLSDGYIGGGRKNWDGSGGSNGALDHFNEELLVACAACLQAFVVIVWFLCYTLVFFLESWMVLSFLMY